MTRFATVVVLLSLHLVVQLVAPFKIEDSRCDSELIDVSNESSLHGVLQTLMATTFFKIFQVNMQRPCQFWPMQALCSSPGCSICECQEEDVPEGWKGGSDVDLSLPMFSHWAEHDDNWIVQDSGEMTYVDLMKNPEGYTGYKGDAARKVWMACYGENCFTEDMSDMCYEQRVFYRLISGLQGSISSHISYNHPIGSGVEWGPNHELFNLLVGNHPDRIQNIYFSLIFLLRAVNKISPLLLNYNYESPRAGERELTSQLVQTLLSQTMVKDCSPTNSFNEKQMFRDLKTVPIKSQMREHFRNISRIMDCVHCDKCKVHSKLAVLGIGTALKILFNQVQTLSRNEVVALLNTLSKFSHAAHIIQEMQQQKCAFKLPHVLASIFIVLVVSWALCLVSVRLSMLTRKEKRL